MKLNLYQFHSNQIVEKIINRDGLKTGNHSRNEMVQFEFCVDPEVRSALLEKQQFRLMLWHRPNGLPNHQMETLRAQLKGHSDSADCSEVNPQESTNWLDRAHFRGFIDRREKIHYISGHSHEPMELQTLTLITQSDLMRSILTRIETIAESDSSVLLIGETGVGKELFAEYIHRISKRSEMPLVKVGLSAVPQDLLESELFGHDKGAYTSASAEKKGLFELAEGGSIFLDDIDDFPYALQSKLLRVLESRELKRVGGTQSIPLNVRLITASKLNLRDLVDRGLFRPDLYYRINVVPITIPPLRDRKDDIPLLVDHFLRRFSAGKEINVAHEVMAAFQEYSWPGNVRELRNIVQRIALFAKGEIHLKDLPPEIQGDSPVNLLIKACARCFVDEKMTYEQVLACLETNLLQQALRDSGGNKKKAAEQLKLSVSTLRDKLKKFKLDGQE